MGAKASLLLRGTRVTDRAALKASKIKYSPFQVSIEGGLPHPLAGVYKL